MSQGLLNYFNYFTEIEEHFQKARATSLFLLSPLDWALIESWKSAGVPLEAVLRGIDAAFEKWRAKRSRAQMVNSLAFCSQAVMVEAQRLADGSPQKASAPASDPFPADELTKYLKSNAVAVRATGVTEFVQIAESLERILDELPEQARDLEALEQRLTALEQKLIALARSRESEETALAGRRELDSYLKPYRGKMSAPQIAMLELQFLQRVTLASAGLPRLSLFYLR
jgi:HPt (histidine-containing phosphotransfer) domain-containing protein